MSLALAGAVVAGISVVALVSPGQSSTAHAGAVDLVAIEQTRLQALVAADTATAGAVMAADFTLINPGGASLTREDYLGAVQAGFIDYLAFEPTSPIDVHRSGNTAVLRFQVSFDLVVGGTRLTHDGWITELYERQQGQWKIEWEQATAIPNDFGLFIESLKPAS